MRLTAIELNGFRGFGSTRRFDLDADAVIVLGANGHGKTSLFDGILWAITGTIPRLGDRTDSVVSMYSSSGQARVSLELKSADQDTCVVTRSFSGGTHHLRFEVDGKILQGDSAKVRLLEQLWPEALVTADSDAALTAAMTRSVYLQQDLVRQFIEADTETERFNVVSELVGTGRITELQIALEHERASWVRATNMLATDLESGRMRLRNLESRLAQLSAVDDLLGVRVEEAWDSWWKQVRAVGLEVTHVPAVDSNEAAQTLNAVIRQSDAVRRATERRRDIAVELLSELQTRAAPKVADQVHLRAQLQKGEDALVAAREALDKAEIRAAEARRGLVEARQASEELRALAQLALRHLGERCPVCQQGYDQDKTAARLRDLAAAARGDARGELDPVMSEISVLASAVEEHERTHSLLIQEAARAEQGALEERLWRVDQERRLRELDIEPGSDPTPEARLKTLLNDLMDKARALATLQRSGEDLSLMLAQAVERARRDEIQQEVLAVRAAVTQAESNVRAREDTAALVTQVLRSMREGASEVVSERLDQIAPLLQRVYARIDPHPAFRAVRFLAKLSRGRGRLTTVIQDQLMGISSEAPSVVLSSSQMNALAVSVFLSFNLGIASLPLDTAILDDPLQSLDDVNLLGVIDLLRRTKDQRQLLISTHDSRFGRLLERKLRPADPTHRTRVVELAGWEREGPTVLERDIAPDKIPFQITT